MKSENKNTQKTLNNNTTFELLSGSLTQSLINPKGNVCEEQMRKTIRSLLVSPGRKAASPCFH